MAQGVYNFNIDDTLNTTFDSVSQTTGKYPSTVKNSFQDHDGAWARWLRDLGAVTAVGGTASAITITLKEASYTGYGTSANQIPDGAIIGIETTSDATGATTLNVNSIGTKKVLHTTGAAIAAKDWVSGRFLLLRYDASADSAAGAWIIYNDRAGGNVYLPSGGKIDFGAGTLVITHLSGRITVAGKIAFSDYSIQGIVGTATNDDAVAGNAGENIESEVLSGSAVSLTTGTAANVTSISLTAGDWEVSGNVVFNPAATTTLTRVRLGLSATSATFETRPAKGSDTDLNLQPGAFTTGGPQALTTGPRRVSVASTTTFYLVGMAVFGVSTMGAYGYIHARRVR